MDIDTAVGEIRTYYLNLPKDDLTEGGRFTAEVLEKLVATERVKVLSEVERWLDEMKKYDWGDLTDYETHEVGIPKGYKRAVNELVAKLNQLKEGKC